MKFIQAILLFIFFSTNQVNAQTIGVGDVFQYDFNVTTVIGSSSLTDRIGIEVLFENDLLNQGESLTWRLYDNSAAEPEIRSGTLVNNLGPFISYGALGFLDATYAPMDFQAVIEVGMLSGSININSVRVNIIRDGMEYQDTFNITSVPVPASVWLFGAGLFGFIAVAKKKAA